MAFGIPPDVGSVSAWRPLLGIGAALEQAWRRVRAWTARSRERDTVDELDDLMLRDIGLIRDRDIGPRRDAVTNLFWPP